MHPYTQKQVETNYLLEQNMMFKNMPTYIVNKKIIKNIKRNLFIT